MDTGSLILVTGVLVIALVATLGGIIALLTQRVVVDDAGHVTDIEIPLLGRFRSNYPSIAAVVIGALLACAPLYFFGLKPGTETLTANVAVVHSMPEKKFDLFVAAIPNDYEEQHNVANEDGEQPIELQVEKGRKYKLFVYTPFPVLQAGERRARTAYVGAKASPRNGSVKARLDLTR